MTYEEKKAWLWRYRSAKRFERLRLDELATLEAEAMHTTQRYSAMPGGGGDGQALPRAVERIEEARQAAEAQSTVCDAIRAELMDVFSQLDNEVDFMILFRRYVLLGGLGKMYWRSKRSCSVPRTSSNVHAPSWSAEIMEIST